MAEIAELAEINLVSYLAGLLKQDGSPVWPLSMQRGAGQNFMLRIFAGESSDDKNGQLIFCVAEKEFPEHIPSSAIYEIPVKCVLRTPTQSLTSADKAAGVPEPLANHSAAAEQLRAAMMTNGLELLLTSPYVVGQQGLTVFGILDRQPGRDQTDSYWESSISCKLVCCAA